MPDVEIHIQGNLDSSWSDWFEGLEIVHLPTDETVLCGALPDQSAVYGVLSRLSSLGLTLISIRCKEEKRTG